MENKLRNTLKVNGLFSTISGLVLLILGHSLAKWMHVDSPVILRLIGGGLLLFAFTVLYPAMQKKLSTKQVVWIIVQDWIWVIGSLVIIGGQLFALSKMAYLMIAFCALLVASMATLQTIYLKK